jgi:hypothetical protein
MSNIQKWRDEKKIAVLSPVAWRTPPEHYGAWETVAEDITEGIVARGWDVTLFATADSITTSHLHAVVKKGYEEDPGANAKVAEYLHLSEAFEHADELPFHYASSRPRMQPCHKHVPNNKVP